MSDAMSRNRYLEIKRYIHLNDNPVLERIPADDRDRLYKIRSVLERLNKNFQNLAFAHKT